MHKRGVLAVLRLLRLGARDGVVGLNQESKKLYDKACVNVESSKNGCMTRGSKTSVRHKR